MPGESGGDKIVYLVDDPRQNTDEQAALSFWREEPTYDALEKTEPYVLSALDIPTDGFDGSDQGIDGVGLQRGEELLVRAIPNRRSGDDTSLYLNVTSFVIRDPNRLIGKGKLRTQDHCPREYYLRYVKNVYSGDRFREEPYRRASKFRGNAVHKAVERALKNDRDRFREDGWTADQVEAFCEDLFEEQFGFEQALLVLSGAGLDVREHIVENVTNLFTDEGFIDRIQTANDVAAERYLSNDFGYAGQVDIILDDVPYDIKTTRDPDDSKVEEHSRQIKLYLFGLLLERVDDGTSFKDAVKSGLTGHLIYPNVSEGDVRFEPVELTMDDVREFIRVRNDATQSGDAFAPPSTYNRDCENCAFAADEWITGPDDALPPACTYHCQNERRWPCYETDSSGLTTQCSLFDDCDQRTTYRDPEVIDHYEGIRAAFRDERRARQSAKQVLDSFDERLLTEAGYRIPGLTCTGASGAGKVIQFETERAVVPAFEPGETVELRPTDGRESYDAIYYGETDGTFLFSPVNDAVEVGAFLPPETTYEATYTFSVETVDRRYLPYLDFAQRRNEGQQWDDRTRATDVTVPDVVEPSDVTSYLDYEEVFIDLPLSCNRNEILGELVADLVTAPYPHPVNDDVVPEETRRALVLGTTPALAERAVAAQPAGSHYRLDGTGGESAIQDSDGYHEIQTRLLESRSLVSTVHQATSANGPGSVGEIFHRFEEGDFSDRTHSKNFFDVLVLLGAERLTEPEYRFLSDIADRVVSIGDTRRKGPEMLSSTAVDAGLEVSHFEREFDRCHSFPSETGVSLQLEGEAPPAIRAFYPKGPWSQIDGELTFLGIEGDEETALETIELETTVPTAEGQGRRLVFDVTDTPISPIEAQELFEKRTELDATALREGIVVIDEKSMYLSETSPLQGEHPENHQVIIRSTAAELPQFSRSLLTNRIAEKIIPQLVSESDPDVVVTPFDRHATNLKRNLEKEGLNVPVRRPEELDGEVSGHAVVSLATANEDRIVRPPLSEPDILYGLLSSGRDLTLVGNKRTLVEKDLFENLIESAEPYNQ
ncbi:PD-(D/E)XK nuclease family protein [Natronorubrum sp. A-ect3]|uniref:PD-(D/E)XK nuclease family protein n=1 Tax=Natronorubrum sp. A-ect3 TaxID=3242698 RepID=UPI00359EDDCC